MFILTTYIREFLEKSLGRQFFTETGKSWEIEKNAQ